MPAPKWIALSMVLLSAGCDGMPMDGQLEDAGADPSDASDDAAAAPAVASPLWGDTPSITAISAGISEPPTAQPLAVGAALDVLASPVGPAVFPARTTRIGAPPRAPLADLLSACGRERFTSVMAAGARPGVLAAWTDRHVSLSVDDGLSWAPALEAPGRLDAVALDYDGTLYVVRAGRWLWSRAPNGAVRRVRIPHASHTIALGVGGGRIAWWGHGSASRASAALSYSDDGGRTWRVADDEYVRQGNFDNRVIVLADRTVLAWSAEEMACGGGMRQTWRVRPDGQFDQLEPILDPFLIGGFGAHGAVYSSDWSCNGGRAREALCAGELDAARSAHVVDIDPGVYDVEIAASRDRTFGTLGRRLYELWPNRASHVTNVPDGWRILSVDTYGRVVGLSDGRVVRRDDDGAWNVLCGT